MRNIVRTLTLAFVALFAITATGCSADQAQARPTTGKRTVLHHRACTAGKLYDPSARRWVTVKPVPKKDMKACDKLAVQPARTEVYQGSKVTVPAGKFRVVECRVQYTGAELSACLRQS